MIKWIKSIWEKLFTKKKEEVSPVKEEVSPVKIDHCATHSRFKKSCPACKALI